MTHGSYRPVARLLMGALAAAAIAMGCSPSADTATPQTADSAGEDARAPDAGADGLVNLIG
jgi:hypothetical protein